MPFFRLLFAAALSSLVNAQINDHVTAPGFLIPNVTVADIIETDERYFNKKEDFRVLFKEKNITAKVPEWLANPATGINPGFPIDDKRFKCRKKHKREANCKRDEYCVLKKVPLYQPDSDDSDKERKLKPVRKIRKPFCLKPCAKVCTGKSLKCGRLAEEPPAYPIWWYNFENQPCFQFEQMQGSSSWFIRTSCKCPTRDYTVSDSCTTNAGASLSNCVEGWLVQQGEINFQNLKNVQLGYVRSTAADIDFQGEVKNSLFCRLDAYEDIEWGGGECPATIQNNVFFNTVMRDKDFQFEEGTTLTNNIFFNVDSNDDFEIKEESGGVYITTITDNIMADVSVADDCKIDPAVDGSVVISGNTCSNFVYGGGGCGDVPFSSGFSCLP